MGFESNNAMLSLGYISIITTALAIGIQSYAFKQVSATDSSIILATEPVWAAGAATMLLGERLGVVELAGGCLIIFACIINELNLVNKVINSNNNNNNNNNINNNSIKEDEEILIEL